MPLCRGCKAEITWIQTAKGKSMPIDAKPIKAYQGNHVTGFKLVDVHLVHWSSCPEAKQFITKKKGGD